MAETENGWFWPLVGTDRWGPPAWKWLHAEFAIPYPERPTKPEALAAAARLRKFLLGLPCGNCVGHLARYCKKSPPDFSSGYALQEWARELHNSVNRRLGKPEMSYDEYRERYRDEIELAGILD